VPKVSLEETWVIVQDGLTEPNVNCGFTVVATKRIDSVLLGPNVNHLSSSHSEGIGEGCTQVNTETSAEKNDGQHRHVSNSPQDGEFVNEEVIAEESGEGTN